MTAQSIQTVATEPQHGAEITVALNRLKASPKNARKTPHSPATIEAFAASVSAARSMPLIGTVALPFRPWPSPGSSTTMLRSMSILFHVSSSTALTRAAVASMRMIARRIW